MAAVRRFRFYAALLLASTSMTSPAHAEPVSAFFAGLTYIAGGGGLAAATAGISTAAGMFAFQAGVSAAAFLGANLGSLAVGLGLSVVGAIANSRQQIESAKFNVRIPSAPRRHAAGRERVGGVADFGDFDNEGAWWELIIHCDEELVELEGYYLDDRPVTIDGDHIVQEEDFEAEITTQGWLGLGSSTRREKVFKLWTSTYSPANPVPPALAAFVAKFPEWDADHKLVGTTFSIMRIAPVPKDAQNGVFRWRGPFGMGEPAVSVVGKWGRHYDPRTPGVDIDDPATWTSSSNPVILACWNRYRAEGYATAMDQLNWTRIAAMADICDQTVLDKNGDPHARYIAAGLWNEDQKNADVETSLLLAMDGVVLFDEDGLLYFEPGYWHAPTLTLTADKDLYGLSTQLSNDGESETAGVVVNWTDPDAGFSVQPAAAWKNPLWFEEGKTPNYLSVDIPTCRDHNQAMRLAKAIGVKTQPAYRTAPIAGVRAIRARRETIINLDYDEVFTGPQRITTPVEVDEAGLSVSFGLVPCSENDWTLLEGEEADKPIYEEIERDDTIALPTGIVVTVEPVPGSNGLTARLRAVFNPPRGDETVEFRLIKEGDDDYQAFLPADMEQYFALSNPVDDGATYQVSARTRRGVRSSDWTDPATEVHVVADTIAPAALTGVTVTGDLGHSDLAFTTPGSANLKWVAVYLTPAGNTFDPDTDEFIRYPVVASQAYTRLIGDDTVVNLIANGDFASGTGWTATNWTIFGGHATHSTGNSSPLTRTLSPSVSTSDVLAVAFEIGGMTAGLLAARLGGGTAVVGDFFGANGWCFDEVTVIGNTTGGVVPNNAFDGWVDNISIYKKTATSGPQGAWDVRLAALNGSGVAGPVSGPTSIRIL